MSNEIVKQEASVPANVMAGFTANDLVIPRLMLMQNTSELVGDGRAKLGDIINSVTEEVVGGVNAAVELIPLSAYKNYRVYDMTTGSPKFLRTEDAVDGLVPELEGREGETPIRRNLCYNFFMLLKKEVDSGEAFPVVVSFTRTSAYAGKQILTQFYKMGMLGKPPYFKSILLSSVKEKFETNTYSVFKVAVGEKTSEAGVEAALKFSSISHRQVKVSEDVSEQVKKTAPKEEVQF